MDHSMMDFADKDLAGVYCMFVGVAVFVGVLIYAKEIAEYYTRYELPVQASRGLTDRQIGYELRRMLRRTQQDQKAS